MRFRAHFSFVNLILIALSTGWSIEVTPYNSWRALIVYTDKIDSMYGGSGAINLYKAHFASLFDGINLTYEMSGIETRAQIAGVVHDKNYSQDYNGGLCAYRDDVRSGSLLSRYRQLISHYSADVIILVQHDSRYNGITEEFGGCSEWPWNLHVGFVPVYVGSPNSVYLWAHEMGHPHGLRHTDGHRLTFNSLGVSRGGPLPDSIPFVLGLNSGGTYMLNQDSVLTEYDNSQKIGFHTTMAYSDGGHVNEGAYSTWADTYGGITRSFRFQHTGLWPKTVWVGTFGSPNLYWYHPVAGTHATGGDSITYLNRLRYIGEASNTWVSTKSYKRDEVGIHQEYEELIRNLKGIPDTLDVSPRMGLGVNAADTQWVYAHFVAKKQVKILPGFALSGDVSMRITVNDFSVLPKKSAEKKIEIPFEREVRSPNLAIKARYQKSSSSVEISFPLEGLQAVQVSIYDMKGKLIRNQSYMPKMRGRFSEAISLSGHPDGVYIIKVSIKGGVFHKQVMKW